MKDGICEKGKKSEQKEEKKETLKVRVELLRYKKGKATTKTKEKPEKNKNCSNGARQCECLRQDTEKER